MIFTERMEKIECIILRNDADRVIEYLGKRGCLQFDEGEENEAVSKERSQSRRDTERLLSFFSLPVPGELISEDHAPSESDSLAFAELNKRILPLIEKEMILESDLKTILAAIEETRAFERLNVPFTELEHLSYLSVRIGMIPPQNIPSVISALGQRAIIFPLNEEGKVLAVSSRKSRFALDTELAHGEFTEIKIPVNMVGVPGELILGLEASLEKLRIERDLFLEEKRSVRNRYSSELLRLYRSFLIGERIDEVKAHLKTTASTYRLQGWLPVSDVASVTQEIDNITKGRCAVRTYSLKDMSQIGPQDVPVKVRHGWFVKAFEGLVFSYGAPLYGTIDPTPLVAAFFVILFAIMFGDVGQGFVGVLIGAILLGGKLAAFAKWKKFGPIFIVVGTASMITGFLYGSVFGNEHLLVPVTELISKSFFGVTMDRFISVMPESGMDKLFLFFGFTIGLGVVINSIGLIINIINQIMLGRWDRALFSKTGLAGAGFFWYVVFLAIRLILGGRMGWFDFVGIGLPLVVLFIGHALYRLISGKRPIFHEGFVVFLVEGVVEILESVSYYFSNSVSFLRVAAFALSHAVLSLIVFKLVELVGAAPGGAVWGVMVVIIGNVIIIVLEGLIVSIQVVRLQYYEFFSKFFTEMGKPFKPLDIMK